MNYGTFCGGNHMAGFNYPDDKPCAECARIQRELEEDYRKRGPLPNKSGLVTKSALLADAAKMLNELFAKGKNDVSK